MLGMTAAFRRLCVETFLSENNLQKACQPPSGGCVLKQAGYVYFQRLTVQPPSGGCVLKHAVIKHLDGKRAQPPSGGCVLKLFWQKYSI